MAKYTVLQDHIPLYDNMGKDKKLISLLLKGDYIISIEKKIRNKKLWQKIRIIDNKKIGYVEWETPRQSFYEWEYIEFSAPTNFFQHPNSLNGPLGMLNTYAKGFIVDKQSHGAFYKIRITKRKEGYIPATTVYNELPSPYDKEQHIFLFCLLLALVIVFPYLLSQERTVWNMEVIIKTGILGVIFCGLYLFAQFVIDEIKMRR